MGRLTFIISIFLLFQTVSVGQDVCVEIKASENVVAGNEITITANINKSLTNQPSKFIWEISNRIKQIPERQITEKPTLIIPTSKDDGGFEIIIALEIESLPNNCLKSYQIFVPIIPIPPIGCILPATFPNSGSWNEEKRWLIDYVEQLKMQQNSFFYILISTKNLKSKKLIQRKMRITNYLTNLGISKNRFKIIVHKSPTEDTRYFVVPKDAQPPII